MSSELENHEFPMGTDEIYIIAKNGIKISPVCGINLIFQDSKDIETVPLQVNIMHYIIVIHDI